MSSRTEQRLSRIASRLQDLGWKHERLARAAGLDPTHFSKIMNGVVTPLEDTLRKVESALEKALNETHARLSVLIGTDKPSWLDVSRLNALNTADRLEAIAKALSMPLGDVLRAANIAIIFAATKEPWQSQYERALNRSLMNSIFTFHPFYPEEDFNWEEHRMYRDAVLRTKRSYAGCILLAPICTKEQFVELMDFTVKFENPVIVVDKNPPVDKSAMPTNFYCVSFGDELGGTLAGNAVLPLVRKRKREKKDIQALVITGPGKEPRAAKVGRAAPFKRVLENDGTKTPIRAHGDFTKGEATDIVSRLLQKGLDDNKPYAAVLGTSGPMTEGVVTAVSEIYTKRGREQAPLVVGYDDTRLLESGAVVGTVVQNVEELADATIRLLKLVWQGQRPKQILTLKPKFSRAKL